MKIKNKHLKNIKVEVTDEGFVLWITYNKVVKGKKQKEVYWLLDASCLKEDGEIRLGKDFDHKINAKYNKRRNSIFIVKK